MRQFLRWAAVALSNRGYQARGTIILRPSLKATQKVSLVNVTFTTRSSAASAKIPIPCLQTPYLPLSYERQDTTQFLRRKPESFRPLRPVAGLLERFACFEETLEACQDRRPS